MRDYLSFVFGILTLFALIFLALLASNPEDLQKGHEDTEYRPPSPPLTPEEQARERGSALFVTCILLLGYVLLFVAAWREESRDPEAPHREKTVAFIRWVNEERSEKENEAASRSLRWME